MIASGVSSQKSAVTDQAPLRLASSLMFRIKDFESVLRQHVLDAWFPRSLDLAYGGYLCDFDRTWTSRGANNKLLEFQARQTLTCADAFRAFPGDQRFRDSMLHGFRYLREVMWDADAGGWFHRLDQAGRPLEAQTKHVHGSAYAIEACAAVYEATGDPAALELASEGFEWLGQSAHDREYGGYFGFMKRDGTVIRHPSECPWNAKVDTIGTEIGFKDANVHSDLLETFVHLYRVWPDPRVGERLAEVLEIVSDKMLVPSTGAMHIFTTPDWRPIPHLARAGYEAQTAHRLTLVRGPIGDVEKLRRLAGRLVDHVLQYMRDPRTGGFFYGSPGAAPSQLEGKNLLVTRKLWWVQVEMLRSLLVVNSLDPEKHEYLQHFDALWQYLQRRFLDPRYGGLYKFGLDGAPSRRHRLGDRFALAAFTTKGDGWKDASHEGRALLDSIQTLRSLELEGPDVNLSIADSTSS